MKKDPKSKLGKLQYKFNNSGIKGNPIITDRELKKLKEEIEELSSYFRDRNDSSIAFKLSLESVSVYNMIFARKNY